jgi:hypothetical protein
VPRPTRLTRELTFVTIALPAALILTVAAIIQIRYFGHRALFALTAFLAGFFIAGTAAAPDISNTLTAITNAIGHL